MPHVPIRYLIDLADRVHHLVRVRLTVPEDLAAGARLVLPVWTPGSYVVRDYVRHVQSIRAVDAAGRELPLTMDTRTSWRLPDDAAGPVDVDYELYANELTVRTNHVDDHHALLIPAATFITVEAGADRPHEVTLPPVPEGHRVWSLLPDGDAPHTSVADDRDHLVDSAFEVGDHPSVDFEVAGVPHTFVWAGHGGRPHDHLDRVAADARAIGEAAVALFDGELPVERYTFLCTAWDTGGGGLEHRDGAVLQIPVRVFTDDDLYARFQSLIAHEYLHLWNVKRLVPAALVRPDHEGPNHSPSLWVAEGWTAYYDELLPTRAEVWTPRRFLDTLRDGYQTLLDTPGVQRQALRQASFEAWTKHYVRDENTPNVATDYYGHGSLVAAEIDLRLRAADPSGDGLDAVLRLLWERYAGKPDGYFEAHVLGAIREVASGSGRGSVASGSGRGSVASGSGRGSIASIRGDHGDELAALVDHRVGAPGLPDLGDEVVGAAGLRWQDEDGPTAPDLGVRTTESDAGVRFSSVLRDRPAWSAGLTGGDELLAIDGQRVARGQLTGALRAYAPGDRIEVTVLRGPRLLTAAVTLGEPRPRRRLVPVDRPSDDQLAVFRGWTGRDLQEV
ncbi:M61 family metallopeptidase [Nitriliruptor alkaliphilus]|uniref:M61 family metallopeptidase n=1 Tax=Nitriliruptor alkaliphilus TaxID=427918 RepID=UPI0006989085|nr:PDZ domain-containing protein [Nitriliruptor alkaliphilus]